MKRGRDSYSMPLSTPIPPRQSRPPPANFARVGPTPFYEPPRRPQPEERIGDVNAHIMRAVHASTDDVFPAVQLDERYTSLVETLGAQSDRDAIEHRQNCMQYWTQRGRELEDHQRSVDALCPPHIGESNDRKATTVFAEMLRATDYPDQEVIECLEHGFPMVGRLPRCSVFPVDERHLAPEAETADGDVSSTSHNLLSLSALDRWNRANRQSVAHMQRSEHTNAMWSKVEKEVTQKRVKVIGRASEILSTRTPIVPSRRFGVEQGGKVRAIDDFSASRVNEATLAFSRIVLHTIDFLIAGALLLARSGRTDLCFGKGDHKGAYRQLPIALSHLKYCVTATHSPHQQGVVLLQHMTCPFGAVGSVHAYQRFSEAVMHVLIVGFGVMVFHYVDDFFIIAMTPQGESMWDCFVWLHDLLRIELEHSKCLPPARRPPVEAPRVGPPMLPAIPTTQMELLGVECTLPDGEHIEVAPLPRRVDSLMEMIMQVIVAMVAMPSLIGSLAGKLSFTTSAVFNRGSRAFIRPLYAAEARPGTAVQVPPQSTIYRSLMWFQRNLRLLPARSVALLAPRWHQVLYQDAMFDTVRRTFGIGGLLLLPQHRRAIWFWWRGHEADVNVGERQQQILPFELMAVVVAIDTFKRWLSAFVDYTDNQAAFYQLMRGAAAHPELNTLVSMVWSTLALNRMHAHFEWVSTHENPADAPSRGVAPTLPPALANWSLEQIEPVIRPSLRRSDISLDVTLTDV